MQAKYNKLLKESEKHISIADHMTYVTFPIVNEKKLLIKIFEEITKSLKNVINSIIYYELENNNTLKKNEKNDLEYFIKHLFKKYNLTENEIIKIKEILDLEKKHLKSPMEFIRKERIVIMSDNLSVDTLAIEEIKNYLYFIKEIHNKITMELK